MPEVGFRRTLPSMSKPAPTEEKTITLTQAELDERIADAVAHTVAKVQRGVAFNEGITEAQEERVARELGKPRDPRKPWPTLTATFSFEAPDWAGPVTGTVEFKLRDIDAEGQPLERQEITVLRLLDWKLPPLAAMQAKHGFDDRMTFGAQGWGKMRPEIKENAYFTKEFLHYVVKVVYEIPLTAMFSGKDLKFIKPYLTSELRPVDLGEIRSMPILSGRKAA